jgi:hypothetical protein
MLVPPAVADAVPPQLLVNPFGVATTNPAGSVSLNATPASATVFAAGFAMVNVSVLVPFTAIVVGLNAFASDGGATTVNVSVAVFPVPPLVEDTAPDVLVNAPAVPPVTFTTTVQELFTAMLPPVRLMLVPPDVADAVPPQVLVSPFGVATTNPAGSVSLNATPAAATVLAAGLVMVNVSVLVPFNGIEFGLNALAIDGGPTTVSVSLAVLPVPPLVELTTPEVFVNAPALVPFTFTTTVQELFTAMLPPDRLMLVPPNAADAVPPQVLVSPFGVATTNPAGSVSLNATPLCATVLAAGLVMVNVSVLVPFSEIELGLNALAIDGGATTVNVSVAVFPVPPLVEDTAPDVLVNEPAVPPVTFTTTVQELFTGMLPPVRLMLVPPAVADAVPPQVLVSPFGVATTNPEGSVSLNAMPAAGSGLAAGLVIVKVSVLVPFNGIELGLNALAIEGGPSTLRLADAVLPVPPLVEDTAPEVFVNAPAVVPVTFTTTVQELLTAMLPPVRLMLVPPEVADAVPPQVLVSPFGVETTSPVGSMSLKATPLSGTVFAVGLVIVKVSVLVPFSGIELGLNDLAMLGGATIVTLAVPAAPVPAVVSLAVTLLLAAPAAVPCTLSETVQLAPGARLELANETEPEPGFAVAVPVQLLLRLLGVATTNVPVEFGSVSVNVMPLSVWFWLVLLTVMVRLVVPFSGIVATPKFLAMLGGLMTFRLSDDVFPFPAIVEAIVTLLL